MSDAATIALRKSLTVLGFEPDDGVMSDSMPGLSMDFGNFRLAASFTLGASFTNVVLFTGIMATTRSIKSVEFEMPRHDMSHELLSAWIVWALDKQSPNHRFVSAREVEWLETGRANTHRLPWELARAAREAAEKNYLANGRCTVGRAVLKLALKSLAGILSSAKETDPVTIAFDGRVLSFGCNGVESVVGATGNSWSKRYRMEAKSLRRLPTRLMQATVVVGVRHSALEIDRYRYMGATEENV